MLDAVARLAAPLALTGALLAACATAPGPMTDDTMAADDCDRACLHAVVELYLDALVANDPSEAPFASDVRFTEDGVDRALGEGFWASATGLRDLRLEVLDPSLDTAIGLAVMDEAEGIVLHAFRLKVEADAITELETLVVQPRGENAFVNLETLAEPRFEMTFTPAPEHLESREETIRIAQFYPDGLKAGSFEEVDAPFPAGATRRENGMILAGPRCTFNETCQNMKTQPSPTRPTLQQRLLAVDEETGVAFYWLAWLQSGTGNWLAVWEAFKVYDGQLHAVEAFLEQMDPDVGPGWPVESADDLIPFAEAAAAVTP